MTSRLGEGTRARLPIGAAVTVDHRVRTYGGRAGRVVAYNADEIGVAFVAGQAAVWFRPVELAANGRADRPDRHRGAE